MVTRSGHSSTHNCSCGNGKYILEEPSVVRSRFQIVHGKLSRSNECILGARAGALGITTCIISIRKAPTKEVIP